MRLGFHAATSMPSDLETDVVTIAHAGFRGAGDGGRQD
jgi:hypothetical protein